MPESENNPAEQRENEATTKIMDEMVKWYRERPGWLMKTPPKAPEPQFEPIPLPRKLQS